MDEDEETYQESYEGRDDGTYISDKLIEICEIDLKDERKVLQAHGFDPEKWVITAYRHNLWHGMRPKDLGRVIMYQSRITVRPKKLDDITFDDITTFFKYFNHNVQPAPVRAKQYSLSGSLLEICLADLHTSRQLADPDARPAEAKLRETIQDIVMRARRKRFSKVLFVPLGDIFDVDTMTRTTSKGTQQYLNGTPYEMFENGAQLMIWAIDQLRAIAPVEYVFIPGNHDKLASYCLAKVVEAYYAGVNNVIVDAEHSERKWKTYGVNLIAWMHGEIPKKNVFSWLQAQARAEWGQTKYAEIHAGHTHTQTVEEKAGQIVRYLPSTADASLWEMGNGYVGNVRSTVSFVWDSLKGLREQWFTNV